MSNALLDFEKPLEELQDQLTKAKQIQEKGKVNVDSVIKTLKLKLKKPERICTVIFLLGNAYSYRVTPNVHIHSIILTLLPTDISPNYLVIVR